MQIQTKIPLSRIYTFIFELEKGGWVLHKFNIFGGIQFPENDLLGRQRFLLFQILSLIVFICGIVFYIQTILTFEVGGLIPLSMPFLSLLAAVNYLAVLKHKNDKLAYTVILSSTFLVLHLVMYDLGGIFSSNNFLLCPLAIITFMLLGNMAGWMFLAAATIHCLLMCYFSLFTNGIVHYYSGRMRGAREFDMLISIVSSLFLIVLVSSSIEKTKNFILERVKRSNLKLKEHSIKVEKTNKELDRFAYIVSHDLKAPLRAINNLTSWLEEDLEGLLNEETRGNFDLLRNRVARMEALIEGILDYSKINRGERKLEMVDLNSVIRDSILFVSPPPGFRFNIRGILPSISGERIKIEQVFSNLFSNAIKYNDKAEGIVEVTFTERDTDYEFQVKDNGPGIDPKYHDKIFVIFQTLQPKDKVESTGVGLAIVKKIIEEWGGRIRVESKAGDGASFIFTIPKETFMLKGPEYENLASVA